MKLNWLKSFGRSATILGISLIAVMPALAVEHVDIQQPGTQSFIGNAPNITEVRSDFEVCDADLNGDGDVNLTDIAMFASDFYSGNHPAQSDFDHDNDGLVNLSDVILLASAIGTTGC